METYLLIRTILSFSSGSSASDPTLGVAGTVFREEGYSSEEIALRDVAMLPGSASFFAGSNAGSNWRLYPASRRGD